MHSNDSIHQGFFSYLLKGDVMNKGGIGIIVVSICVSGCTGMSGSQKTTVATLAGVTGGVVGAVVGGQQGAVLGVMAGSLAAGALNALIANDAFSQMADKTAKELENTMSAKVEYTDTQDIVLQDGQTAKQINKAKYTFPKDKVEIQGKLSSNGKNALQRLRARYKKTGGSIAMVCPTSAPKSVVQAIKKLNIYVKTSETVTDYELYAARNINQKVAVTNKNENRII